MRAAPLLAGSTWSSEVLHVPALMPESWRRVAAALFTTLGVHAIILLLLTIAHPNVDGVVGLPVAARAFDVTIAGKTSVDNRRPKNVDAVGAEQAAPSPAPETAANESTRQRVDSTQLSADETRRAQYLLKNRLQSGPMPLSEIEPVYPERAGSIQGKVVLTVYINEQGKVDEVVIVRAFPEGLFEAAAVEAFAKAQFSPGKQLGVPVKSQFTVEVAFSAFTKM